jgi:hypothetical protein
MLALIGQEAESPTGVMNMSDIEKSWNDRNGVMQRKINKNERFGYLIDSYDYTGNDGQCDVFAAPGVVVPGGR